MIRCQYRFRSYVFQVNQSFLRVLNTRVDAWTTLFKVKIRVGCYVQKDISAQCAAEWFKNGQRVGLQISALTDKGGPERACDMIDRKRLSMVAQAGRWWSLRQLRMSLSVRYDLERHNGVPTGWRFPATHQYLLYWRVLVLSSVRDSVDVYRCDATTV